MSPSTRPKRRSRSSGDSICAASTLALKLGACRVDGVDDEVGERFLLARVVPAAAVGQMRRHVLHEQARDVLARRRQRGVQRRGDQHLHHRLARPAVHARIEIGALQVVERRADDDAGAVVVLRVACPGGREIRQLGQRHVHAERAGARLDAGETARAVSGVDGARRARDRGTAASGATLAATARAKISSPTVEHDAASPCRPRSISACDLGARCGSRRRAPRAAAPWPA